MVTLGPPVLQAALQVMTFVTPGHADPSAEIISLNPLPVSTATLNIINKSQRILIVIYNTKHDLGKKYYTVGHSHQFEIHCCCFNILASYGDIASLHVNTLV